MSSGDKARLNIFIDETGEFGLGKRSARLYGISLVFHEQQTNISKQLAALDGRFRELNFSDMVHMGDLINGHGAFDGKNIKERKKIYFALYKFSASIDMYYYSIIFQKRFADDIDRLAKALQGLLKNCIEDNFEYLKQFDEIVVYYDSGQKPLARIIDEEFGSLKSYRRKPHFDHSEKKLFQVADMLTFLDKLVYKHKHSAKLSKSEQAFFSKREIRIIAHDLARRNLIRKTPFRVFF